MNGHFSNEFSHVRARSATQGVLFLTLYFTYSDFSPYWKHKKHPHNFGFTVFWSSLLRPRWLVRKLQASTCLCLLSRGIQAYHHFWHFPGDSGDRSQTFMLTKQSLGSVSRQCVMFSRLFPGSREATVRFG